MNWLFVAHLFHTKEMCHSSHFPTELDDYPITFSKCNPERCVNVPINNDNQVEGTRTYQIRLERPADLDRRIQLTRTSGTLTVYDDPNDGQC